MSRATLFVAGVCLLAIAAHGRAQEKKPLKVFLLAGQSNMVGSAKADELPEALRKTPPNVQFAGRDGRLGPPRLEGRLGPEISFAHAMAKAFPDEQIVIIKYARGGTSALAWSPEWTKEGAKITQNENVGPLFDHLMETLDRVKRRHDVEVVAMLWAQGGRDARFEKAAAQYEQNLKKIIEAARKQVGKPELPFILARTVDVPKTGFPHVDQVRQAQERIANQDPHAVMILTDDLSQLRDNIHFDTKGQIEQGERFAQALLEMLGDPSTK
ncbi:MAG: sialate O-acetylesterase [Pirellulaceae bacterium]